MKQRSSQILFLALVLGLSGILLYERQDLLQGLSNISLSGFFLIILVKLLPPLTVSRRFKEQMQMFGVEMPFMEWFGLSAVTTFYSRFVPLKLGSVPRAVYLKKKYQFDYTTYLSSLVGINLLDILVGILWGIIISGILSFGYDIPNINVLLGMFLAVLCAFLVSVSILLYSKESSFIYSIFARINSKALNIPRRILDALKVFKRSPKSVLSISAITVCLILVRSLALWTCFQAIGYQANLLQLSLAIIAVNITSVASLTPGNLGITEGTIVAASVLTGIPAAVAVPAAILSRICSILVQIALGIVFSYALFGKFLNITPSVESVVLRREEQSPKPI